ncbi:tetratricopeptide repeat protein, partial [Pseudoalteromonas fuliginea]
MHNHDFEAIWSELKLTLEWHEDFSLFFVFVENTQASFALKQRLDDFMRSHSKPLRRIKPITQTDLPNKVIDEIFDANAGHSPVWLALTQVDQEGIWDTLRAKTLATLNKRRSQLEDIVKSPIFIELPYTCAASVVTWAPDIWSVRQQIIELPSNIKLNTKLPQTEAETSNEPLLSSLQLDEAIYQTRAKIEQLQSTVTNQGKRHLSIALDRLGDLLSNIGQLPEAKAAYAQSLAICQQLQISLGDSPQVLRDLSVSFNKVGNIELQLGDLPAAKAACMQSLAIRQQLQTSLGDSPQVLRDLSVSFDKVGNIEQQLGDLPAAKAAYAQSLAICQQLQTSLGDSPQVLRDLSVSFNKVGNIELQLGDLPAAKAAYAQSLAIRQQLQTSLGDSPQVLRDLSVSFDKVGNIEL